MSSKRCQWLCCTWFLTWYIPGFVLGLFGIKYQRRMAWREKLAICIIIFLICCSLLFLIVGLGRIICPKEKVASIAEIDQTKAVGFGKVYDLQEIIQIHVNMGIPAFKFAPFLGSDISGLFYKNNSFSYYCRDIPAPNNWDNVVNRHSPDETWYPHTKQDKTGQEKLYLDYMNRFAVAKLVWSPMELKSLERRYIIIHGNVYDISSYYLADNQFFGPEIGLLFEYFAGKDATAAFQKIENKKPNTLQCMNEMFYVGQVDRRSDLKCLISNYLLLSVSILVMIVIAFKFLAAMQFDASEKPEAHHNFVIMQVPCYTESLESLTKTFESLATTNYPDERKLMFVIADGQVHGNGNMKSTPTIVKELLGCSTDEEQRFLYESIGDLKQNYATVYSGYYDCKGHSIPYIFVVKVGLDGETFKPGNRGKRDSQLIVMRLLSRLHFNQPLNPLEFKIADKMIELNFNPNSFEFLLMIDADTTASKDSINKLVSSMVHDVKISGICGETLLANENETWITMIQVYEYFISHHLSKAFESLFGSVTCLPGCFCMYRIKALSGEAVCISPMVVDGYSESKVDTLHMKNLLQLGEDRYLTTLVMKHFPSYRLKFNSEAKCHTVVPSTWSVLLSQRRRWINSTVHNLIELLSLGELCGFCCLSMRFVVFLDLFSTVTQPIVVIYVIYLIFSLVTVTDNIPLISLLILAAIYGFQVVIFVLKRQWAQIGWMIVYILALPIYSFYIPVYSFWHFDDFSWGTTRIVVSSNNDEKVEIEELAPIKRDLWNKAIKIPANSITSQSDYAISVVSSKKRNLASSASQEQSIKAEIRAILATEDLSKVRRSDILNLLTARFGVELEEKLVVWIEEAISVL